MDNKFYMVFCGQDWELEIVTKTKEEAEEYLQMCDPYLYYIVPQTYNKFIKWPEKKYRVPASFWDITEGQLIDEWVGPFEDK